MTDQARNGTVVGVIGLGNAGYAVASTFAKLSPVHGYDLNGDKRTSASQRGIITHNQFDAFTAAIDIAIMSLPHPDISLAVTGQLLDL